MDTNFYNSKEHIYTPEIISSRNPVIAVTSAQPDATLFSIVCARVLAIGANINKSATPFVSPFITGLLIPEIHSLVLSIIQYLKKYSDETSQAGAVKLFFSD